jgi:hypothetical protein
VTAIKVIIGDYENLKKACQREDGHRVLNRNGCCNDGKPIIHVAVLVGAAGEIIIFFVGRNDSKLDTYAITGGFIGQSIEEILCSEARWLAQYWHCSGPQPWLVPR